MTSFFGDEIGDIVSEFEKTKVLLKQKSDELEKYAKEVVEKNNELQASQAATLNLLEDLDDEKKSVEKRIKLRTEELVRERNKLLLVVESIHGGCILLDETGKSIFANRIAIETLGLASARDDAELVLERFHTYFEKGNSVELLERCKKGQTVEISDIEGGGRHYQIFFHFLQDWEDEDEKVTGSTLGYVILFFDTTEAKLLERSKSELVAVASHQLRTPLTAIRGNIEMLLDGSFGDVAVEQQELLSDINLSTIRLISMVNDMLDITKIESKSLELQIEKVNVKDIIDSVVEDLKLYASTHEFEIKTDSLLPDIAINGDRMRVRQIFQNLTDNAIKYSNPPGKLEISMSIDGDKVIIAFKDNGIGVPEHEQPKLFSRFYRASNTAKTASSGSGLGLYIVKSIAQQHGGDIRFVSKEDEGTTFIVEMPIKKD